MSGSSSVVLRRMEVSDIPAAMELSSKPVGIKRSKIGVF